MPATSSYTPTSYSLLYGILYGSKWAVGSLTYSFPTSASFYGALTATRSRRAISKPSTRPANGDAHDLEHVLIGREHSVHGGDGERQRARRSPLCQVGQAGHGLGLLSDHGGHGGDAWFNNSKGYYDNPLKGNYGYLTLMHETGHALGLKHPHEVNGSFGAMPLDTDSLEYSVMSYRSYVGGPVTGYTVGSTSYPQTLMMYDIAALQKMYGANYSTNGGDTVYTWSARPARCPSTASARARRPATRSS